MAASFPASLPRGLEQCRHRARRIFNYTEAAHCTHRSNRSAEFAAALLAGAVVYITGLLWLGTVIGFDKPVLQYGLYPFIFGDIVKAALAAILFPAVWKAVERWANG